MHAGEDVAMAAKFAVGETLGLFRIIGERGPIGAVDLADCAAVSVAYTRGWLTAMAASGWLDYDPATGEFRLPIGRSSADQDLLAAIGADQLPACAAALLDGLLAALPPRPLSGGPPGYGA